MCVFSPFHGERFLCSYLCEHVPLYTCLSMRAEVSSAHAVRVLFTSVEVAHTSYDVTKRTDEAIYSVLRAGKRIGSPPLHPLLFFSCCVTLNHILMLGI